MFNETIYDSSCTCTRNDPQWTCWGCDEAGRWFYYCRSVKSRQPATTPAKELEEAVSGGWFTPLTDTELEQRGFNLVMGETMAALI